MTSIHDLGLAYRKAKVDLYYSSHASLEAIADYEEELLANLTALHAKIESADTSWVTKPEFIGTWTLATKSVKMPDRNGNGLIFSSPADEWEHACEQTTASGFPPTAMFRVMAKCSLDFHVLSSLWILKVGHLFDAKLTNSAYGNRLRRTKGGTRLNELALGSFQPYLKPFRDWRDKGITTMRDALDSGKKVVALTADIRSFYHELNPSFMLNPDFVRKILHIELDPNEEKLHFLFIQALRAWAECTPLKSGLPVGLPASAVVANVALAELDRIVEKECAPLYYGRYVDDILLVLENGADFRSTDQLWEWLFQRSDGKLDWVDGASPKEICFKPHYMSECRIRFANDKNKVFLLAGEPGKTLVDAISHQIHERASEWRALPRLPRSASHVSTDLLAATQSNGEAADNLRKTDALTMLRAGFALKLRDFEAYERDLTPDSWREHRLAFFQAFIQHVMVLPHFFDLSAYLPRVIRLATACEDFEHLRKILLALKEISTQVAENCKIEISGNPRKNSSSKNELIARWQSKLYSTARESISAAFPPRLSKAGQHAWQVHMANRLSDFVESDPNWLLSPKEFQAKQARLFSCDLAHMPFRFIGLPSEMVAQRGIPTRKTVADGTKWTALLSDSVVIGAKILANWTRFKIIPQGFLLPTRPYNLPELFILNKEAYHPSGRAEMNAAILALRGFNLGAETPRCDKYGVLQIPDNRPSRSYGIAVCSWKTRMESWTASVMRMPDPDADRYARLCRLLDGVIAQPHDSRYLILPELALPAHWFIRIASKLQRRGISLISGIEYLHVSKSRVRNQVWAALSHDGLGFPSFLIYQQDKQRPAFHEEKELVRVAGLEMKPDKLWKAPPILQHGDLRFALLVCSELTNIRYRADLRGKVDAVFVPEWNQDTETFNALVESAALDIHAYIIQCNDREYGDSRIRAPFKDSWKRDLLRVKGGVTDYCVIGEIDVQALRQFQSNYRSPAKPFKPVPDGFEITFSRKVLP